MLGATTSEVCVPVPKRPTVFVGVTMSSEVMTTWASRVPVAEVLQSVPRWDKERRQELAKLNEELRRFLSPWAYEESSDIAIGGRIHANRIVDFVERRDYVDYVGRISLFTSEGDGPSRPVMSPGAAAENLHGYFVEPGVPEGVLVTAPLHQIDVLSGSLYQNEDFTGIGYCKIELDFAVG